MVIVGRGSRRERGSRRILGQSAFTVVEFLPVVVSVALSSVVISHRVLCHVSKHVEQLEEKQKNLFLQIFQEAQVWVESAPDRQWAEQGTKTLW